MAHAAALMQTGRHAEAEAACRRIVEAFPSNANAHHLLGVLLGERGETAGAIASLERAVRFAPKDAGAWMNLGVVTMKVDASRAEACFRRVVQLAPTAIAARGNLATLFHEAGRYDDAQEQLE